MSVSPTPAAEHIRERLYFHCISPIRTEFTGDGMRGVLWSGLNPGKWTRGFNQDAIVSVANPAASKAFGER